MIFWASTAHPNFHLLPQGGNCYSQLLMYLMLRSI